MNDLFNTTNLNSQFHKRVTMECMTNQTIQIGYFGLSKIQELENVNSDNCIDYSQNQLINVDKTCDFSTIIPRSINKSIYEFYLNSKQKFNSNNLDIPDCEYDLNLNKNIYLSYTCIDSYIYLPTF